MLVGLGIVKQVAVNVISYPNRTISHQYLYPFRIEFLARAARRRFQARRGGRPHRAGRGQVATERKHLTEIIKVIAYQAENDLPASWLGPNRGVRPPNSGFPQCASGARWRLAVVSSATAGPDRALGGRC